MLDYVHLLLVEVAWGANFFVRSIISNMSDFISKSEAF